MRISTLGIAIVFIFLCFLPQGLLAQSPGWQLPNVNSYANQMTVTGAVLFSGEPSRSATDEVAFFVDGEIRGVGVLNFIPDFGLEAYYSGTIYSNMTIGETVQIMVYHDATSTVYTALDTIPFQHQDVLGDFEDPFEINIGQPVDEPILLENISDQVTLETFPFDSLELVDYLTSSDEDPVIWSLQPLATGVTWTSDGSTLRATPNAGFTGTDSVRVTVTEQAEEEHTASTVIRYRVEPLVQAPDWTSLSPQSAAMGEEFLQVSLNDLVETENERCISVTYEPVFNENQIDPSPNWNPVAGQSSMTLTTVAQFTPNSIFNHEDDQLAAFINGNIAGVALPVEFDGRNLFFLNVASQDGATDEVELRFYSGEEQQIFIYPGTMPFVPFGQFGTPIMPEMRDFSPFFPTIDQNGNLTITIQNPAMPNVQAFTFSVADCSFPQQLNDEMQAIFCYGSGINEEPLVELSDDEFLLCAGQSIALEQLVTSLSTEGYIYAWSTTGDGNFNNAAGNNTNSYSEATTYTFGEADVAAAGATLTLTVAGGYLEGCNDISDEVIITLEPDFLIAACENATVNLGDPATEQTIDFVDLVSVLTSNCGTITSPIAPENFTVSPTFATYGCADLGANALTLTITGEDNKTTTCTVTVTVADNVSPNINCPANVVVTATSDAGVSDTFTAPVGTDNCTPTTTQTAGFASDATFPLGVTTVTFQVSDAAGNTDDCSFTVTVEEISPGIMCPASISVDAEPGLCSATVDFMATDPEGIPMSEITYSQDPNTVFLVGTTTVTATATNSAGTDDCSFTVTVTDNEAPTISCPANVAVTATSDAGAIASFVAPVGTDNCTPTTTQTAGFASDATFPLGVTTVTFQVSDAAGNTDDCSFTVTVEEISPGIMCPASISVDAEPSLCSATVDFMATDPEGIPMSEITYSQDPNTAFLVGTTTVSATATNSAGTDDCSFTVTVTDNEAPTISCPANVVVTATSDAGAIASFVAPVGTDNCTPTTTQTAGFASGATFPLGATTVTFQVSDAAGNTDDCSFTVTVEEVSPGVMCPANISVDAEPGLCSATVNFMATDPEGIPMSEITYSQDPNTAFIVGTTTVTATTTNSAGTDDCSFTITVTDNEAPTINCPANVTVTATSDAGAIASFVAPVGTDNCTPTTTQTAGFASGATFPLGVTTVTFQVSDATGNTDDCSFTVTVEEVSPGIMCPASISVDAEPSLCSATVDFMATDPEGIPMSEITYSQDPNTAFSVGTTTVTATATNSAGTDDCSFTITVTDNEAPVISCPTNVVVTATSDAGAIVGFVAPVGTDNCTPTTTQTVGFASGETFPLGATTVTFQVSDAAGNTNDCSFTVTVEEVSPNIMCPVNISVDAEPGLCSATVDFMATDPEGIPMSEITYSQDPNTAFSVGTTTVTATATNSAGTDDCSFTITVTDNEAPVISCPMNLFVIASNTSGELVNFTAPVWSDNCAAEITQTSGLANGEVFPLGLTTNTFLVTDLAGNSNTCSFGVQIGGTPPLLSCPVDITVGNEPGVCAGIADFMATDEAGVPLSVITYSQEPLTSFPVGVTTVTALVTNNFGADECTFTVTVTDIEFPVIVAPDTVLYLDENGLATLSVTDYDQFGTDNCSASVTDLLRGSPDGFFSGADAGAEKVEGAKSLAETLTFTCSDVGEPNPQIQIVLTDDAGNETTQAITVTVLDTISPTATPVNQLLTLTDQQPIITLTPVDLAIISDNCDEGLTLSFDRPLTFTGDDIGENTLTVTVTDASGNMMVFTVTVIVGFEQPQLACLDEINVTLSDHCDYQLIPSQVLTGNAALLNTFQFDILVMDSDTSNGAIIDGCGRFNYVIRSTGTGIFDLDFEMCWGVVNAEDKTSPEADFVPEDVTLLCVDFANDANNVSTLTNSISRCYRVNAETGATIAGSMAPALRARLLAGRTSAEGPLVPTFTDGCAQALEVCVSDAVAFSDDADCDDIVLARTFVATEISTCVSAAGEANAPAVASYQITFDRPTLADLNTNGIQSVVTYEQCGTVNPTRADYPAPRATDFPSLIAGDRVFNLRSGEAVCNIGVTYADGPAIVTCPFTYKFIRTYTVIDWCDPSDIRTFTQVVKVGDTTAPVFTGPSAPTNANGYLVYGTNAGNICAAYLRLDDVSAVDNCSGTNVSITADIYPGGDLTGTPIGAFNMVPGGTPELSSAIPVGRHLLRYSFEDECGNADFEDFFFVVEDQTPPVAICEDGLNISIASNGNNSGFAVLTPAIIDAGAYDDCSAITRSIARVNANDLAIGGYSDQITLTCAEIGTVRVGLRVTDALGNEDFCWLDVLVEDKLAPTCIAPADLVITCDEYNTTLPADIMDASNATLDALFGTAAGVDNCGTTITQSISGDVNSCGVGSFVRTFISTDDAGFTNTNNCTQNIRVDGVHDYRLTFPVDVSNDCATIPEYDGIGADELACDLITTTTDVDTLRTLDAGDECFKLRITYDIVNWCEYNTFGEPYLVPQDGDGVNNRQRLPRDLEADQLYVNVVPNSTTGFDDDQAFMTLFTDRVLSPNAPQNDREFFGYAGSDSRGFFRYVQFIKIYDEVAPVITTTDPAECFAGNNDDCSGTVELTFRALDACSDVVVGVELDADYVVTAGFVRTADITGNATNDGAGNFTVNLTNVPVGEHAIRIRASDGCGNFDVQLIEFCVAADRTPTPICIQTLTVTLMNDGNGGGIAAIWASDFIASPIEDCYGNLVTKYSLYRTSAAGANGFLPVAGIVGIDDINCADHGDLSVRIYAFDDNGSTPDFCEVVVQVQDNAPWCSDNTGSLSGRVLTPANEAVAGVTMALTEGMTATTMTDENGAFAFRNLELGSDYTVQPSYEATFSNRDVKTSDLVAAISDILGTQPFDNGYDYIAADVNRDGEHDVRDVVTSSRAILGITNGYPAGNWSFTTADAVIDVSNPYGEAFPEVYNVNNLQGSFRAADFVAIMMGDLVNSNGRSAQTLKTDDARLEAGQTHTIVLDGSALAAFQGTLELGAGLELIGTQHTGKGGMNLNRADEGMMAIVLWDNATVSLEVRATTVLTLSQQVSLTDAITVREGVGVNGLSNGLNLAFSTALAPAAAPNVLKLNTPNPVDTRLRVLNAEEGEYQIFNVVGQEMLRGELGNDIDVSRLPGGTYFLKVSAQKVKFIKR